MTITVPGERRTIESLRAGVPSASVVSALGSDQVEIEEHFTRMLDRVGERRANGILVGGGFGTGKSHLLQHLGLIAQQQGYAVSRVVISKETLLYDPAKVVWAALDGAVVSDAAGPAIEHIASTIDVRGSAFAELVRWAAAPSSGLDERFAASLLLYSRLRDQGDDFCHALVRFWSGEALSTPDTRRKLREIRENYTFHRIRSGDLARQRLRFTARLMNAAGYRGWIVLFDEVELIGRYSLLARAKAYAEVNRWITGAHGGRDIQIGAVFALTDDFASAVFDGKKDRTRVPERLRTRQAPEAEELAKHAEAGMDAIERDTRLLTPPDDDELDRTYQRLKKLHGAAFDWNPPDVAGLPRTSANRMRQYVRAWINEWDLLRLNPSMLPSSQVENLDVRS